jgi:hypothetical protein
VSIPPNKNKKQTQTTTKKPRVVSQQLVQPNSCIWYQERQKAKQRTEKDSKRVLINPLSSQVTTYMLENVLSKEQCYRLHTVRETDFTEIVQPGH